MNNVHPVFATLLSEIREATQTLANCAAQGKLQKDGTRMPNKPLSYDSRCEDLAEAFLVDHQPASQVRNAQDRERFRAEKEDLAQTIQDAIESWFADRESVIADLETALEKIADIAGDYGDGAPDSHYLAVLMLELEAIATSALDEARGTHRKALEAMQKRQQP